MMLIINHYLRNSVKGIQVRGSPKSLLPSSAGYEKSFEASMTAAYC